MTRAILMLVVLPIGLRAQGTTDSGGPTPRPRLELLAGQPSVAAPVVPGVRLPSPPVAKRPRPQGSMVGYIDDAVVGSRLRVRFDAGSHSEFPDRAEFFYGKCGCYRDLVGVIPAGDANAPGPQPGVATDLNFQGVYLSAEYAPSERVSFFGEIPARWLQPKAFVPTTGAFPNQSGLGDIKVGAKLGLIASDDRSLTLQVRFGTKSGDASKGLGTGHTSVEPAVLSYERLSPRLAVESEVALWHPMGGSAGVATTTNSSPSGFSGNVLFYGIGPSYELYRGDRVRFAPVLELVGWRVLAGYQTVWVSPSRIADKVDGTNIVNLKLGARTSIGDNNSLYVGYGRALTDAAWYKNIIRVEYRRSY